MFLKTYETFRTHDATYVHNYYNICNILIYFYNIDVKHLQHRSKAFETFKIYSCNMFFRLFG
jgi:hypothetical protein